MTSGTPDPNEVQVDGPYFIDARHALYAGWIMGTAMRHGFDLQMVDDGDGNFTNRVRINLKPYAEGIELVIPYPPPEWRLIPEDDAGEHPDH